MVDTKVVKMKDYSFIFIFYKLETFKRQTALLKIINLVFLKFKRAKFDLPTFFFFFIILIINYSLYLFQ